MTSRRRQAWATIALLSLLSSCGSADGGGSGLTLNQYAARANAICAGTIAREQALGAAPRFANATPENLVAAAAYLHGLLPLLSAGSEQLHALGAPDQKASEAAAMLVSVDAAIEALRQADTAAAAGDRAGFGAGFGAAVRADQDASTVEEQLGLPLCVQLSTQPFRHDSASTASPVATPVP